VYVRCPLVVRDESGFVDWRANGWPEPTPFYGSVDMSNIPQPFHDKWLKASYICEEQFEGD
jgi:hypothetical protein